MKKTITKILDVTKDILEWWIYWVFFVVAVPLAFGALALIWVIDQTMELTKKIWKRYR